MKEEAEAAIETAKGVLQDIVVVVSLVRTLTDSFGSARDLYRKLKRKPHSKSSDDEEEFNRRKRQQLRIRRNSSYDRERSRPGRMSWNVVSRKDDYSDSDEELICTSSSQIRAEYERGYRKLGEPFARGDYITQTQLQSQIIQLQQTLLNIQQDLLLSTYLRPSSSHSHLVLLIQTTRTARAASIRALNLQYQRMLPPISPIYPPSIPGAFPLPLHGDHEHLQPPKRRKSKTRKKRSGSSSSSSDSSSDSASMRPTPKPKPISKPRSHKLFCVYARDLQKDPYRPLTDNYKLGGDNRCPYCHLHIAIRPGTSWEIVVDGGKNFDEHTKMLSRTFHVRNRFLIKSHRESGGFACVLCARFSVEDTICKDMDLLLDHLEKEHTSEELGKDEDIVER